MNMQNRYHRLCVKTVLAVCLLISACGYRFSGGGNLPEGVTRLSVGVLENRTRETGLENMISNEVINYFTRFENVQMTDKDDADACLSGIIKSANTHTIAHRTTHASTERRIRVVLDLKLTTPDGRLLWKAEDISEDETYVVASEKLRTEQNKKSALLILSERIAERIYYRMTDNF